ncbi:MAG: Bax inhibitor-1/YccA family protein [Alphaproteobacteria bacterium]|nr:Bax inhibitor-1/YccA family protein [Alphaproteobacteria bacterium]
MVQKTPVRVKKSQSVGGIDLYLRKIFTLMFGAVGVTAITAFITIYLGGIRLLVGPGGMTPLFYILVFGGLALSIWAQARAFSMRPAVAAVLLFMYAVTIGLALTPIIWGGLAVNPASIVWAFIISAAMFGFMAAYGYKTAKDLSFLGIFLMMGMIGLILVGIVSMIWTLGGTFSTIVCAIGVLVFALFTAYDMQTLKRSYEVLGDDTQKDQLAVLGALHLYISFIAMFQYVMGLLNRD